VQCLVSPRSLARSMIDAMKILWSGVQYREQVESTAQPEVSNKINSENKIRTSKGNKPKSKARRASKQDIDLINIPESGPVDEPYLHALPYAPMFRLIFEITHRIDGHR
jgi:hypothetical protein